MLGSIYQPPTGGIYYDPNAPKTQYNVQNWGLDRIDQRDLPMNGTYTYTNTGAGVNVYNIDSGIRPTHQEFGGRAFLAADVIGDGYNGQDCSGHGTAVAGIIGGSTHGVAKGVRIHSVRVYDCSGYGWVSNFIAGIDWVTANHVKPAVANIEVATGGPYEPLDAAVSRLISAGVTCVVAAGNDSQDVVNSSPGRVAGAITVGASSYPQYSWGGEYRASFSNYGPGIDVYAPGTSIITASFVSDTDTTLFAGTSAATPFVAGVAARYIQRNPGASPATVSLAIKSNATTTQFISRLLYSAFDMAWQPPPPTCKPGDKEACEDFGGTWNSSTCTCSSICFSKPWLCGY